MAVDDFLRSMGMGNERKDQWAQVIVPNSVYAIYGDIGKGKTALAIWLLERFSKDYDLIPGILGFPLAKRGLLPETWITPQSVTECFAIENAVIAIDEAGLQFPIEARKANQFMTNLLSLPRHRNQIVILTFHYPRMTFVRFIPYFGAVMFKRPSYWGTEYGSKDYGDLLSKMMKKAEERFSELADDERKYTFISAPRIRWEGMLESALPTFWTEELSTVWKGAGVDEAYGKQFPLDTSPLQAEYPRRLVRGWHADDPEAKVAYAVTPDMERRAAEIDRHYFEKHGWVVVEDPLTKVRWLKEVY